jgi:succinyl-diaminopimelate desuccinylase
MSDVVSKTEWLVGIASPTKEEHEISRQLLEWARTKFAAPRMEQYRCGFLLEPQSVRSARPTVALVGHIDTVPPAAQQRLGVCDGRLYGCGASDMKAGVAAMMEALENWQAFPCNLVGLFYDREEGPYADNGLEPLLEFLPPVEFAVVLEPTNNVVQAGCVGSIQARVHFHGKRAHSARPWQGDNAMYKAVPLLQRLAASGRRRVLSGGLEFSEVVTATQAFCPGPSNAVPELFTLNLNARFAPGKTAEQACAELAELVAGDGELEILDLAPSGPVQLNHPVLQAWIERTGALVEPKQAWTDVARFGQRGIPAFNFGPGDPAQAHQADEWVELASLHDGYARLCELLGSFPQT